MSAFVAVADDASAVAWNPAGLVNGPIFNILFDFGRSPTPKHPIGRLDGDPSNHAFLAAGVPPLGLFYARGHHSAVEPADGRKEAQVAVRSMVTSSLGFTVLQSLADGLTVGATVKLVHGSVNDEGETTGDIDAGALFSRGRMRAGLVARNLTSPTFESSAGAITIERHVRAGVAWGNKWPGTADTIVSFDADLTRVPHVSGERRDIAAGAEKWFRRQTIALRGGVRASTVDGARPVASAGGSVAVRSGFYLDVAAAGGRADDARWSIAARLMY
jgi:F plasmid transfer operon protein TraF